MTFHASRGKVGEWGNKYNDWKAIGFNGTCDSMSSNFKNVANVTEMEKVVKITRMGKN